MAGESGRHLGTDRSSGSSHLLRIVRFFWTEDAQVHLYRTNHLAVPGWEHLVPMCEDSRTPPRRHDREHLARRPADNILPAECPVCARWAADAQVTLVLIDYAPPSRLAIYRTSHRESVDLEPGIRRRHSCHFCLATYRKYHPHGAVRTRAFRHGR